MKQLAAFVLVAIAFSLFGASTHRALTKPWGGDAQASVFDVVPQKEETKGVHLYAPQLTANMVSRAAKVVLHLDGIHATTEVDTVRVMLLTTVSGQEIQAGIASLKLGFSGDPKNKAISFDITAEIAVIKDAAPSNFLVAFIVRGPNQREPMDLRAFDVDETYFELFDAQGNPIQ